MCSKWARCRVDDADRRAITAGANAKAPIATFQPCPLMTTVLGHRTYKAI